MGRVGAQKQRHFDLEGICVHCLLVKLEKDRVKGWSIGKNRGKVVALITGRLTNNFFKEIFLDSVARDGKVIKINNLELMKSMPALRCVYLLNRIGNGWVDTVAIVFH